MTEPRDGATAPTATEPLLHVADLHTEFRREQGEPLRAVDGVSFDIAPGRALAIVGESGSGKSVTMRTVLRLLPRTARTTAGTARFQGRDLLTLSARDMRRVRGRDIGMVFQNAMEAMNPTLTLERQLTEHLLWHGICGKAEAKKRAVQALADVGIPEPERRIRVYPFQLSGGMRQRAMIAMAMITQPALLIADEPTTAVDVTVQRQILDLLAGLKERGTGIIMITHDLGVARYFCDDAVVMYAGRVVERAPTRDLLDTPRHPYTRGLLGSSVEVGGRDRPLAPIPGSPPDLARRPVGCAFHPRCAEAQLPRCREDQELIEISTTRAAACWRAGDDDD
ncbi:ABC transporter ATP-binding protein [Phytoactinopolyspora halotolerans]|uniref:ABC transporter ATP-binding protein n=2 Tax=Phytoactinopolyspora halotolerans TaxID=1981512 RepID=A0A6L9SJ72_9ACTN|nr:ABC transporter ATP-binding protein [Phytoactinopolyspora halotolerans]